MSNRRGIITFSDQDVQENKRLIPDSMRAIGFIPEHRHTVYDSSTTNYVGTCSMFEKIGRGFKVPYYDIKELVKQKEQDNAK